MTHEWRRVQPLPLNDDEHNTYIRSTLKPDNRRLINRTLIDNAYLFSWTAAYIPEVSPKVIAHCLSIYKEAKPVAQKKRKLGEERCDAAREDIEKLFKVGFLRKAHYTTWLANVIMV